MADGTWGAGQWLTQDPRSPGVGIISSTRPGALASPLDIQTEAGRAADAARQQADAYAGYAGRPMSEGSPSAVGAPQSAGAQVSALGQFAQRFQRGGVGTPAGIAAAAGAPISPAGNFSLLDFGKRFDNWYDIPVWERDKILAAAAQMPQQERG